MKLGATEVLSVALVFFMKDKTGGLRPARRHTFVRQQKYAKVPSPCGGHLLCLISEQSTNDIALEAGPLQWGLTFGVTYREKARENHDRCNPPRQERLSRASGHTGEM